MTSLCETVRRKSYNRNSNCKRTIRSQAKLHQKIKRTLRLDLEKWMFLSWDGEEYYREKKNYVLREYPLGQLPVPDTRVSTLDNREGVNQLSNLNRNINILSCLRDQPLSCPALHDSIDCSPPGFSVHGILQTRILEWTAVPPSRGSSRPRDWMHVSCGSCGGRQILYHWTPGKRTHCHICTKLADVSQSLMLLCLTCTQMTLTMLYR